MELSSASMSLSRRYLSLPQELEGSSLPPQVDGKRYGTVMLSVGHILESAVSSRPLPKVSLVRVRWWGEEQPRSLFRPILLSSESAVNVTEEGESPMRAIAMKYPVVVPPEQLEEYFRDMRNLTLDVIDRNSRRKIGQCTLKLDVESENSVLTAEEKLVALKREDVLCEIKNSEKEDDEVLGYLAVTFDVQWDNFRITIVKDANVIKDAEMVKDADVRKDADVNIYVDALSSASSPSKRESADFKIDREIISSLDVKSELLLDEKEMITELKRIKVEKMADFRKPNDDSQRIQRLLEKGKALKQSMEKAVKSRREEGNSENIAADRAQKEIRDALLLVPDKTLEMSSFSEDRTSHLTYLNSKPKLDTQVDTNEHATIIRRQNEMTARRDTESHSSIPDGVNTMSLAFESLELERNFVENQLRQLRDFSSVSSRFSPIQICVSHGDVASLLCQNLNPSGAQPLETQAFSVSTSLRKRQWNLECSSTISLTPSSTIDIKSRKVNSTKWLKFHVRCDNQSDARRNKRRQEQQLHSRSPKCYILEGTVDVSTLHSVAAGVEKTWATTVELFVVEDYNQMDGNKQSTKPREGLRKQVARSRKSFPVGKLHVRFSFYDVSVSSQNSVSDSADNELESEYLLSSITSGSDIHQERQSIGSIFTDQALSQEVEGLVHSKFNYAVEDKKLKLVGSELLQFGVMLEDVTNVTFTGLKSGNFQLSTKDLATKNNITNEGSDCGDGVLLNDASLSLHYTVPSQFTMIAPASIKYERTVRRKLTKARWTDSAPPLRADFGGHIHIFQTILAEDANDYLSSGQLIIEVWLHTSSNADRILLGLSKVRLRKFTEFLRRKGSDLHDFSTLSLPYIGEDGQCPISNPFTGIHVGFLRVRVCMGTAEQLHTFATTVRSFIKFQGVVRGMLYRRQYNQLYALNARDSCAATSRIHEVSRSDTQSTTPTVNITGGINVDLVAGSTRLDTDNEKLLECGLIDFKSEATEESSGEIKLHLHRICFDICECWRSQQHKKPYSKSSWRTPSLLGCELQGQLVLIGGDKSSNDLKGIPFALWWDAADSKLNSCFVHAFHKTRGSGLDGADDLPVVGLQSQVLFALNAEDGFIGTQSRQTISGEARVNLYAAFGGRRSLNDARQHGEVEDRSIVLNVPIKWGCENSEDRLLPTFLPLKISYQVSVALSGRLSLQNRDKMRDSEDEFSESSVANPYRDSFASDKLLQPASITISFRLFALANIEHLLAGNERQERANELDTSSLESHLNYVLMRGNGYHTVIFEVTLCLGSELHERENLLKHERRVQQCEEFVYEEHRLWYKRWRSFHVPVDMNESGCATNLDELSSQLAMDAHIVLTPEIVSNLQEECVNVVVLLWCNVCNGRHELGKSEVPMASLLYRTEGVRGMFPIRKGIEPTTARVGVHCFLNHDLLNSVSDDSLAATEYKLRLGDIQLIPDHKLLQPLPLMSPTSPEEITQTDIVSLNRCHKKSCEVWIEEGRNIVVNDSEIERWVPRDSRVLLYATAQRKNCDEMKQNDPERNGNAVKRTQLKEGVCPQWNYRDLLDADDVDWQNLSVDVSVWQRSCDCDHDCSTVTNHDSFWMTNPSTCTADSFVGNVHVDLSLFARGWRDIDGWYHLLDGKRQNRGQVKVHVKNIMVEDTLNDKILASSDDEPSWNTDKLSTTETHTLRDNNLDLSAKAELESSQLSLDDAVRAVYETSEEIYTQLKGLEISEEFIGSQNQDALKDEDISGDDGRISDEGSSSSASLLEKQTLESDEDNIGLDEGDCENEFIQIATDFFKPISLASFGINEMELSPLTEVDASVDDNTFEANLETDDISCQPCDEILEADVKCEDSELSCEESGSEVTFEELEIVEPEQTTISTVLQMKQNVVSEDSNYHASSGDINAASKDGEVAAKVRSDSEDESTTPIDHQVDIERDECPTISRMGNHDGASTSDESEIIDISNTTDKPETSDTNELLESGIESLSFSSTEESHDRLILMSLSNSLKECEDKASLSADAVESIHNENVAVQSPVQVGVVNMLETEEVSRSDSSASDASEVDAENDKIEELECDDKSSGNVRQIVQYADKAVQVNLLAENVTPSPQSTPKRKSATLDFDWRRSDHSFDEVNTKKVSTVDVGCETMEIPSFPCSNEEKCQFEDEKLETSINVLQGKREATTGGEADTSSSSSKQTTTDSLFPRTNHVNLKESYDQGNIPHPKDTVGAPSTELQSEKLEMVYEMLREMRDSYFSKPLSEPVKEDYEKTASKEESRTECSCPSPGHSTGPTSPSRDLKSSVAKGTTPVLLDKPWNSAESERRVSLSPPIDENSRRVCVSDTPTKSTKLPISLRRSLYNMEAKRPLRATQTSRTSSSDVWVTKQRKDLYSDRHVVQKEEISSVHSLFAHDSETERIARIMQGSMNYWMKEDSSSSEDDELHDDEDTTDDDCYF